MAFTSLAYAVFLPLALLAYFAVPARGRWAVLLAFSYGFYMSWHPQLILLLWLDTLAAWAGGLALGRARTRAGRGAALALGALPCLGALFFFKYFAFAAETLAALLRPALDGEGLMDGSSADTDWLQEAGIAPSPSPGAERADQSAPAGDSDLTGDSDATRAGLAAALHRANTVIVDALD